MDGFTVVVLLDDVVEGVVGNAEKEVGEVDAGVLANAAAGVGVAESAVVVGAIEAERGQRFERADIEAEFEVVVTLEPGYGIGVDVGLGLGDRREAVGGEAVE